ncbi:uncharacterized protein TrAtP1_011302 [Trichoderma atroviride]|uniref:uncharacterized protein n=2 Tax=Hypocrea atroviridis TaxID=63577 RepID=UPI00331C937B|nr:hypothetical protein TrAtP1_011302 [Trichoderma atroviride]
MSRRDDDISPSVTPGVPGGAADPEIRPPTSSSPTVREHVQQEPVALGASKLPKSAPRIASRSPIEAAEEKFPVGHAETGSDPKPSRESSKATKTRWDPFARYHSNAHSFPDYVEPKRSITMGPERLKQINGATRPVNTLSVRRHESLNDADAPASKRQKKDIVRTHDTTASPYFHRPKPSKSSDIRETHVEGSHDDIYDIRSISSAGNTSLGALGLDEYRHTQPPIRGKNKGRRRRSQTSSNSVHQTQSDAVGTKLDGYQAPGPQSPNRNRLPKDIDSPDVLASEQRPSTVTNAGFGASRFFKRDRPHRLAENSRPQIKRQKPSTVKEPIDVSEDELQADFAKYTTSNDSKKTASRTPAHLNHQKKATMRGDIHPTVFKTSSQRQARSDDMAIVRAVCGKYIYERGDNPEKVFLRREDKDGRRLEAILANGSVAKEHSWLGIDLDQVSFYGYSEPSSRYGYIMRSNKGDAGPKLYLEFESINKTKDFCDLLRSANVLRRYIEDLGKKAEKAFDDAKNWMASNIASSNIASNEDYKKLSQLFSTDEKEKVIIPRSSSPDRHPGSSRGKLKDVLIQSAQDAEFSKPAPRLEEHLDLDLRRSTRSSAPATRPRLPSPDAWSKSHPDWEKSWPAPLIFPETGKNRATVDKIDIPRLNESEFLNDNLINFYIRHLQFRLEKERPELLRKVYFFSTFFFEKLKSTKGKINYDGVKAWTARVDLLSYDYIFVPVNEHTHWYLAIICNLPNAAQASFPEGKDPKSSDGSVDNAMEMIDAPESPRLATVERDLTDISLEDVEAAVKKDADGFVPSHRTATPSTPSSPPRKRKFAGSTPSKFDPTQPRIITLDSLGSPHAPTIKALKEYLVEEAKAKKGITLETIPTGMTARGIPEQNNFCDCGVFVLGYMEEFLINPDEAARKLFLKEELGWNIRPSDLRNHMRELLFKLQNEQQKRHLQQREEKRLLKAKRKAMTESSSQVSSPPKPAASPPPAPKLPGSFPSESPERKPMSGTEPSSSEPIQEADNLKDSKLNGEILPEDEQRFKALSEPQFISCLSDASGASPTITKGKIPPIASTKAPEEPQFIGCLSDGESASSNLPKSKIPPQRFFFSLQTQWLPR